MDSIEFKKLKLQSVMAIASFTMGSIIALVCLFVLPPLGEIASTAISIVSEFLVLAGALLGVSASFDLKLKRFEADIIRQRDIESREVE